MKPQLAQAEYAAWWGLLDPDVVINKNKNDNSINSKDSVTSICSQYKRSGENNILYLLMIHFLALSVSIHGIIGTTRKNDLWMMNWKVEGKSWHKSYMTLATASRDWGQSQKLQFRILLALTNFYPGMSRVQATNIRDDQTWLVYIHQQQWKHHQCHYSKSFVTRKVLKHSIIPKHKNSSLQ